LRANIPAVFAADIPSSARTARYAVPLTALGASFACNTIGIALHATQNAAAGAALIMIALILAVLDPPELPTSVKWPYRIAKASSSLSVIATLLLPATHGFV
jgi:hypothetical protein